MSTNCLAGAACCCLLRSDLALKHWRWSEGNGASENFVWHNKYLSIKGASEDAGRGGSIIIAFIKYGDKQSF